MPLARLKRRTRRTGRRLLPSSSRRCLKLLQLSKCPRSRGKTVSFQGAPPESRIVVLKFESMDKAQAWWDSPARKNADAIGEKYATFRIYAVEGASP
jgi:hypothetical protein